MVDEREKILALLDAHVNQRAGMDPRNYGSWSDYRSESRSVTRDLHDYRVLRRYVGWRTLTAEQLRAGFRAFSGRLQLQTREDGKLALSYCTGQYFPTEYRKAACAVLSAVIWDLFRADMPESVGLFKTTIGRGTFSTEVETEAYLYKGRKVSAGDWLRQQARNEFGAAIARRWFS
jgi:hypothetical protein